MDPTSTTSAELLPPVQYLILHQDISQKGVAAVQAAHAAVDSLRGLPVNPEMVVRILQAKNGDVLKSIQARLQEAGIFSFLEREPDAPYNGEPVALGVEPLRRDRVEHHMKGLKVFR